VWVKALIIISALPNARSIVVLQAVSNLAPE
jgi:hypothetical protein